MKQKIVVGISGGSDSVALLDTLLKLKCDVTCVHVNYHKRETSMRDQCHVEDVCARYNVPLHTFSYDMHPSGNFQRAAREFRYALMVQVARAVNADIIAVGHHQDDALETFMMQEAHGRTSEVPGISEWSAIMGMPIWRPLISWEKKRIVSYCEENDLNYVVDESNYSLDYNRNRVRQGLKSLTDASRAALLNKMYIAQIIREAENQEYSDKARALGNPFSQDAYLEIDATIRVHVLRYWLEIYGVLVHQISRQSLQEIDRKIERGAIRDVLGLKTLALDYDHVYLYEKTQYAYVFETVPQAVLRRHFKTSDDGDTVAGVTLSKSDFPITIRNAYPEDSIALRYGTKKINRYFIDNKIPHAERLLWPVIENASKEVIQIVGIGCDIRHFSNNPNLFMVKL